MDRACFSVITAVLFIPPLADAASGQNAGVHELPAAADGHAANEIFGEEFIAENARSICRRAAELDPADRFEILCRWVLPGAGHPDFRVDGILTQTDPSPLALELDPGIHRSPRGATIVSPVFDLLDAAGETGKLAELRDRIGDTAEPVDEFQQRARAALQVLVHLELGETDQADSLLTILYTLAAQAQPSSLHDQWPETLLVSRGRQLFPDHQPVADLLTLLYSIRTLAGPAGVIDEWHTRIVSLMGQYRQPGDGGRLNEFVPVVRTRAGSRGPGAAHARWERADDNTVHHVAGHQAEYLFYRSPLRGNFTVECDVGCRGTTQVLAAGRYFGVRYQPDELDTGTFRAGSESQSFAPPFSNLRDWVRYRADFHDGTVTVFLNGRRVHEERLSENYDPWIGIQSWWRHRARFRDFRIVGQPEVPESILMSASPALTDWLPYYGEYAGRQGAAWQWHDAPAGVGQIVGARYPAIAGSFRESLLRYHRPLDENGSVEFEFFYHPGEVLTHPALDRLAFILEPGGIRLHWMTDGVHDRTQVHPDNLIDEPQQQRGTAPLPLLIGAWNRLKLSIPGDVAHVELNGELVYERPLEPRNRRTFGLFHFSDQTEVRVRNVVMRGGWPDVPSVSEQELADPRVARLDASRDLLTSVFTHDFREGIPDESFRIGGNNSEDDFVATADGILVDETSSEAWTQSTIFCRFSILGDFDVEASFDRLDTGGPEGISTARLTAEVEGEDPPLRIRTERRRTAARGEHLNSQLEVRFPDGTRRYVDSFLHDESASGRLRLARRGETVTTLFAQGDSPIFRIIGAQTVGDGPVPIDGVRLALIADNGGRGSVVWKDITLRAEQLQYVPEDDKTRRLYSMNSDGSNLRELFEPPGSFTHLGSPEWSTDGRLITLDVSTGSTTTSHIFVVDADNGEATDLGPGCMPSFSQDGSRIVFSQPGQGIMMMDADGTGRRVIDSGGWGVQWSPDGNDIAWGDSGNITVRNVDTGEQQPLLLGENAARYSYIYWNLGWSHDSRSIAFKALHRQTGEYELAVADIDSPDGFQVLYSTTGSLNADFTFSPDNQQVLFAMHSPEHKSPRLFLCNRNEPGPPTLLPGQPSNVRIFDCAWSSNDRITFAGQPVPQPVDWPMHRAESVSSDTP